MELMEKVWTAYDEDAKTAVTLINPELVNMTNGQKAVMGESSKTGKLLYRYISAEEATKFFKK